MNLNPGLPAVIDGENQNIFSVRRRWIGTGAGTIQHAQQLALTGALQILDRFSLLVGLDASVAGGPDAVVDLAVLGLKLRPTDRPLGRVEPEAPFILA